MRSFVGPSLPGIATERRVHVAWTERDDGDFSVDRSASVLEPLRRAVVDRPWVWLRQVHGAVVVDVVDGPIDAAIGSAAGSEADALVTGRDDVALAVHSADCATLALWSDDGTIAAVHCGWRGLEAGVVDATIADLRRRSDASLHAVLGPSIGPECYEFGLDDLDRFRARFGADVVGETSDGRPALDVRAAIDAVLAANDVDVVARDDRCTACAAESLHSYRARSDSGRQALVVWIEAV